jgi:hypothetical protein
VGTTLTISFALAIAQGELHSMKGHDATIRGYDDLRQRLIRSQGVTTIISKVSYDYDSPAYM